MTLEEVEAGVPAIGRWVQYTDEETVVKGLVVAHRPAECPQGCPCDRLPDEKGIAVEVVDDDGFHHIYGDLNSSLWQYIEMPKKNRKGKS